LNIAVLIPAYQPSEAMVELVRSLSEQDFVAIVVVNDGSTSMHTRYFELLGQFRNVHILRHLVNQGKGGALKTGLNYVACSFPEVIGVVTADADGQHHIADIRRVAEELESNPESLVLGCRKFEGVVPLRSRVGNSVTRTVVRALVGCRIGDTQTGLRGIGSKLIPDLLRIKSNGYDFELDMILLSRKHEIPIRETPIKTIYINNNASSHFNPLIDSMRIYFVLLRFAASSMASTTLDFAVFTCVYWLTRSVIGSLIAARAVALGFNYLLVRRAVFNSRDSYSRTLPRYLALAIFSGTVTYILIRAIIGWLPVGVVFAKACAETLIFFFNFAVQRDFVFARPGE